MGRQTLAHTGVLTCSRERVAKEISFSAARLTRVIILTVITARDFQQIQGGPQMKTNQKSAGLLESAGDELGFYKT
jgi:hypothetical protein